MTSKKNRIFSLLLTMLLLFSFCSTAFALNIVDEDLYDYFEYYADGTWQDLNTVMYTDSADGDVGYCIEHEAKPPRPVFRLSSIAAVLRITMDLAMKLLSTPLPMPCVSGSRKAAVRATTS